MVSCDDYYDGGGRWGTNIGSQQVRTHTHYSGDIGTTIGFSNLLGGFGSISNMGYWRGQAEAHKALYEQRQRMNDMQQQRLAALQQRIRPAPECVLPDCKEPMTENPEEFCEKHWNNFKSWRER